MLGDGCVFLGGRVLCVRPQELQKGFQAKSACSSSNKCMGILLEWLGGLQAPKATATSVEGNNLATYGSMKKAANCAKQTLRELSHTKFARI